MPKQKPPPAPMTPLTASVPGPAGPPGPPGAPGPPLETLEQRIYDLLAPFRELNFGGGSDDDLPSHKDECKALILCENIAFIIRHNQSSYGKVIEPNDVSFAAKNWVSKAAGNSFVGISVFVNGNGFTHTVLRTIFGKDDNVVEKLAEKADELLQPFFPGI